MLQNRIDTVITDLDRTLRSIENDFTKDDLEILDELKN